MAYNFPIYITLICIPLFFISSHTYSASGDNKDIRFSVSVNMSCRITVPQNIEVPEIPYLELMNTAVGTKLEQYQTVFELEAVCGGVEVGVVLTNLDGSVENNCLLPMPSLRLCLVRNTNTALNFSEPTSDGMAASFSRYMLIESHRKTPIKVIPYRGSGALGFGQYSSLLQITISPK